jgi:hypothetical protein
MGIESVAPTGFLISQARDCVWLRLQVEPVHFQNIATMGIMEERNVDLSGQKQINL